MSSPTLKLLLMGSDVSASKSLKGVGDQAEHTSHSLRGFGEVAKGAFAAFAGLEAVKGSVDFLKEAAAAATEDQESTDRLAKAMHNNAGATKAQDAAVEGWISKMELAKGVADDDLRGGLQRLVQSTHSVSESQKLMGVAMDAAAGTGKSVTAVAAAMAKAHDGNVGALGRLGIATKDANGHTLTFNQTVAKMAATFKGQANKAAESNAGQMKRLKLTFDEFREGIGYKLLPILTKLGAWFLDKGVPALQKMGSVVSSRLRPVMAALGPVIAQAGAFITARLIPAAIQFAHWFGNKIVPIVKANLIPVLNSLRGSFARISAAVAKNAPELRQLAHFIGSALVTALKVAYPIVRVLAQALIGSLARAISGAIGAVAGLVRAFNSIKGAVSGAISKVVSTVKGLPGKIVAAVGDLSGILLNAGKSVIDGLVSGIRSGIGKLTGVLHEITSIIPKHKGPLDKDKVLLTPAGKAIMDGLIKGIQSKRQPLRDVLKAVTDDVRAKRDKLAQDMQNASSFADSFSSFSSSIFGADYGTDANGNALPVTVSAILAKAQQEQQASAALAGNVQKLTSMGLSSSLLQQMQAAGSSGIAQINALASSATVGDIQNLNRMDASTYANDRAAGMSAAATIYGGQISADAMAVKNAEALVKALKREGLGGGDNVMIQLDGKTVEASVKKTHRKQGKK